MSSLKEILFRMVAAKELSAAQALSLLGQLRANVLPTSDGHAAGAARAWPPVAVIGMAGRFPGAGDVETFWSNLRLGRCAVDEVPAERWDLSGLYDPRPQAPGKTNCKWGGFLRDVVGFDAPFFNISPREAELMDPQQRLFLEEAWKALEDAGCADREVSGRRCGVFVGAGAGDYIHELAGHGIVPDGYAFMGNANSILAARIAYLLNLKGPCLTVDTACSSALTAIHLACESLALGTSELALAGGVCVLNTPTFYLAAGNAGMLSPGGRCRVFDRGADGFVPAEAVGVLVLKPLADARRDGDFIYGVIEGSGVNQDGKTNGITAPSAPAQTALELEVYERFGIDPATLGYVEAHGTGTRLGDPIEIEALTRAFRRHTDRRQFCAVGSVKSNIGHAMSAAGVVSVIKVLLALRHRQLPPSLHFEHENPAIGFADTPFFVPTALQDWKSDGVRRAAVSSFGFSGTNVHMVIGEAPAQTAAIVSQPPYLLTLSARTPTALQTRVTDLEAWFRRQPPDAVDLAAVCRTLTAGRTHFEHRLAGIVHDARDALTLLAAWRAGQPTAPPGQEPPAQLRALAERYVAGQAIDWDDEPPTPRRRTPLPTYPFEHRRYGPGERTRPRPLVGLHPLIDQAVASADAPTYQTAITATLPFIRDHVVQEQPTLPGACLIEMTCAALSAAQPGAWVQRVEDVVFLQPVIAAAGPVGLRVRLQAGDGHWQFSVASQEDAAAVYAQGRLFVCEAAPGESASAFDRKAWLDASREEVSRKSLYRGFQGAGVVCGPFCQGIVRLWLGAEEALAELGVPPSEVAGVPAYAIHPTLLDGAFQAALAWLARQLPGSPVLVPFAVGEVARFGPVPASCYAYVKAAGRDPQAARLQIALLDEEGRLLVRIKDFRVRAWAGSRSTPPAPPAVPCYRPVWVEQPAPAPRPDEAARTVVIVGDPLDHGLGARLAALHGQARVRQVSLAKDFGALIAAEPIDALYFLGGMQGAVDDPFNPEAVEVAQRRGVFSLLRLVQALFKRPDARRPLRLTVVTNDVQPVLPDDPVNPFGAGLVGLTQTVARECPWLRVNLIDLSTKDLRGTAIDDCVGAVAAEAAEGPLVPVAYRRGRRYARVLELADQPVSGRASPFRKRGAYVILGGAGGLGMTVARHLAAEYAARVLLVGRGELGSHRQSELAAMAQAGGEVWYQRADITDRGALAEVLGAAQARWGTVHGVIHAAMVLQDRALESLDEATFAVALAPKVAGSVVAADLLRQQPLDFFAFFSSANSFFGNPGQANYAAASTFQDGFATYLARGHHLPVKIINWGIWGEVGAVASAYYCDKAAQLGVGAISCAEGIQALEQALRGEDLQIMPMKVEPATLRAMGLTVREPVERSAVPSDLEVVRSTFARVEQHGRDLLVEFFRREGLLRGPGETLRNEELRRRLEIIPAHHHLLDACLEILRREQLLRQDGDQFRTTEHAADAGLLQRLGRLEEDRTELIREVPWAESFLKVLAVCLGRYAEVLRGRVPATEVLFGQGTIRLVERLYRENPVVDFFNAEVAKAVRAVLASRRDGDGTVLRILEVGAGTGGTTGVVLEALAASGRAVEYHYTDLSAGFVRHGRGRFGEPYPFARFGVLDIEKEPAAQGFETASFDVVLASNVLHATANIRTTVRHVRQLLRPGALLVLNEATQRRDFSTLTFGLTEGWWRFEDGDRRLPHSPLLDEAGWRTVLAAEGFGPVDVVGGSAMNASQSVFLARAAAAAARVEPLGGDRVVGCLRRATAQALNMAPADVQPGKPFAEYGVDSIVGVDLIERVNRALGLDLPSTALFDHPSVAALAAHIEARHAPRNGAQATPMKPPQQRLADLFATEPKPIALKAEAPVTGIAVVGLAGRFPGAADARQFWDNLQAGVCSITEVPGERWDVSAYYDPEPGKPGKSPCKWGAFLEGVDRFDPLFFQMSGAEAEYTDPQHRLFLETAWHALEDAGYSDRWLDQRKCGVFVGVGAGDYLHPLLAERREPDPYAFLGNGVSILASRLSYLLNLRGPAVAVDTACSSSLVALHLACQSLLNGDCDLALAGGVFISTSPSFHYLTGRLGMLSPTGQCRAFDDVADGFVPGEAVGAVVLRPLDAALRDGDTVYAVIRGTGTNQDGRSNGLTAPNPNAQAELEQEVYRRARIDPGTITYVETHGTGTRLGDPIEIEGLTRAFASAPAGRCAIGSVKTNVGHAGPAAGIVGLIKVILALRHRQLPPSLGFRTPNRHIRFAEGPFHVNRDLQPWEPPPGAPRRAAISSFGLSGTNAHVVVEEAPARPEAPRALPRLHLLALAARCRESLQARLEQLHDRVLHESGPAELADWAYTLNFGRAHFEWRAALVVSDRDDLVRKLGDLCKGFIPDGCFVHPGPTPAPNAAERAAAEQFQMELASRPLEQRFGADALRQLAQWYISGHAIGWEQLYRGGSFRKLSLPGYAFHRQRYWLPMPAQLAEPATPAPPKADRSSPVHYFRCEWQSAPARTEKVMPDGAILVLDQSAERVVALRQLLQEAGVERRVCWVQPSAAYAHLGADNYVLAPDSAADYESLLRDLDERRAAPAAVLTYDWPESAGGGSTTALESVRALLTRAFRSFFHLAKALARRGSRQPVRVLTFNGNTPGLEALAREATAGYSRPLRFLNAGLSWTTVHVAVQQPTPANLARIALTELAQPALVAEVFYDDSGRHERRALPFGPGDTESNLLRPQGVYWITGGGGALGGLLTRYLAEKYQARVVLSSRKLSAGTQRILEQHPSVEFRPLDVTDAAQARQVYDTIRGKYGRLNGVIHAAGRIGPAFLPEKDAAEFDATVAPKSWGTVVLDHVTRDEPLDFFVLFSSLAALVGDFGQCDYAVANRFLDAFAAWRSAEGRAGRRHGKTVAINWPLWADGGMHFDADVERTYLATAGLEALPTGAALEAFARCLALPLHQVALAGGDLQRIVGLLSGSPTRSIPATSDAKPASPVVHDEAKLHGELRRLVADLLKLPEQQLGVTASFSAFGLDSLNMKELAELVSRRYRIRLSPTAFFEHDSIEQLARLLIREHGVVSGALPSVPEVALSFEGASVLPSPLAGEGQGGGGHAQKSGLPPTPTLSRKGGGSEEALHRKGGGSFEPIAIIGISGRFPQSRDLDELWRNLEAERDLITEAPPERWAWRENGGEASPARWGGFVPDVDRFDAEFFNISPREAAFLDPRVRLFLECVWATFEDAGYRPSALAGQPVGVFVGCQASEYLGLIGDAGDANPQAVLGNTHTMVANRVSFAFDLRGPSEAIDTACSSSLVAVHRAVRALQAGECRLAVAGGVSALLSPRPFELGHQLGMLSPRGRCRTFDRSADGYVKGEGVGAILLKPLREALADGDHVHAVLRASGVNHGGKASFLTAPNPEAQAQLLIDTYQQAGIDPATISYVEAHGTGTELGDPIEVDALRRAFRTLQQQAGTPPGSEPWCGLGTVKSNLGHLEPAAGMAGLAKMILALRHQRLPATLHVQEVNPYLQLEGSPFYLVTRTQDWRPQKDGQGEPLPRRVGISSFGFGGTNAHVVLEEAPPVAAAAAEPSPRQEIVPISGRSEDGLKESVQRLHDFLSQNLAQGQPQAAWWPDLVYTLQVGREPMSERLAVLAGSPQELLDRLAQWLQGAAASANVWHGSVAVGEGALSLFDTPEERNEFVRGELAKGRLAKVARLWTTGLDLDWTLLHGAGPRRRLPLPTYPFARTRHWFDARRPAPAAPAAPAVTEAAPAPAASSAPATDTPVPCSPAADAAAMRAVLKRLLSEALYLGESAIDDDTSFVDLGLDSILAVELVKRLNDELQLNLKATRLYDYANIRTLAGYLAEVQSSSAPPARVPDPAASPPEPSPVTESAAASPEEEVVYRRLKAFVSDAVGLPESQIDDELDLLELGLELVAAERIAASVGREWSVVLRGPELLGSPGVRHLAREIQRRRNRSESAVAAAPASSPVPALPAPTDIAIVGMSGRFPGARTLDEYWDNLARGIDSVIEVPPERWPVAAHYDPTPGTPQKTYCKRGGYLADIDLFDPLFFNISPQEAEVMDPQQRLFLEEAWKALEDAGYADSALANQACAIYVGAGPGDYQAHLAQAEALPAAQLSIGNVNSILAARLAYLLNLKGAAVAVDTACSSALVAVHLACQALRNGECDVALAGGVCVLTSPQMHVLTSQARMLSPDGKCKTFDAAADGFVPAEGVGVVVLKPLARALQDGDRIHAVVRGTGINQDGKTNGITAPNARAQADLQRGVYERYGIDPATIGYVEAHGTGTKLGDPIEVEALTNSFRAFTPASAFCAVGSVKTNIGHALPAAGIAGLLKAVLALRHGQLPPTLHCARENEHIDFAGSPFYVNRELRPWPSRPGQPRRAAVNSFGFSGTNAHVVLEESPPRSIPARSAAPAYLVTLSAKSDAALRRKAAELEAWLATTPADLRLEDVSYTLNIGRSQFPRRWSAVVATVEELRSRLHSWGANATPVQTAPAGASSAELAEAMSYLGEPRAASDPLRYRACLQTVADAFAGGQRIDWTVLHPPASGRRIALPGYPFERRRCWVEGRSVSAASSVLDEVTCELFEVRARKRLTADEPLVRDHRVHGRYLLPGVAYLELACAAAASNSSRPVTALRNIVWKTPCEVADAPLDLHVRLRPKEGAAYVTAFSRRGDTEVIHAQGDVEFGGASAAATADLAAVLNRCPQEIPSTELYERFRGVGIEYGPRYRLVRWVRTNGREAVGRVELAPDQVGTLRDLGLHAGILDAALQTILGLVPGDAGQGTGLGLPFALDRVRLHRPLERAGYSHVRLSPDTPAGGGSLRFDVAILNDAGDLLAQIDGLTIRVPTPARAGGSGTASLDREATLAYLRPVWELKSADAVAALPEGRVLVVRAAQDFGLAARLAQYHTPARTIEVLLETEFRQLGQDRWSVDAGAAQDFESLCDRLPPCRRVYFLGGVCEGRSILADDVETAQQLGVWSLFRLLRGLTRQTDAGPPVQLYVLTNDAQPVADTRLVPHGASLIGLARVIGREFPQLKVACIDLSRDDLGAANPTIRETIAAVAGEAAGSEVVEVAYRRGQRYQKGLARVELPPANVDDLPLRPQGVYLIVGGAGGLGATMARYLTRQDPVRLALVGRRPLDARIREQVRSLEGSGSEAAYFTADVTDAAALSRVRAEIRDRWGAIHGVIHSALILRDRTLHRMSEDDLRDGLAPKVRGSCVLAEVLANEPLDWFVFFSSAISLTANAGQGNYLAASQFQDAFGLHLGRTKPWRVRVVNWGYWGETGVVAGDAYRQRARLQGVASISAAEGEEAFGRILAADLPQVAPLKVHPAILERLGVDPRAFWRRQIAVPAVDLATVAAAAALPASGEGLQQFADGLNALEAYGRECVVTLLESMGLVGTPADGVDVVALRSRAGVAAKHARLLEALLAMTRRVRRDAHRGRPTLDDLRLEPIRALLDQCLQNLGAVLTGRKSGPEVLFPDSSMHLVEAVYRGNPMAERVNRLVARTVQAVATARGPAPLRILEVGAGTGSATAFVLEALAAGGHRVEYCFTDLSRHFLQQGRQAFAARYPFVDFRVLDLEKEPAAQGFEPGGFDVLLAVNVLHATRRIDATLRRLKQLLRANGILVLQESVTVQDFMTLTFGLTEGWWAYEDSEVRLPHAPLLDYAQWLHALAAGGFRQAQGLGLMDGPGGPVGHAVIMAASDGWVVDHALAPAAGVAHDIQSSRGRDLPPAASEDHPSPVRGDRREAARRLVRSCVLPVLKLADAELDDRIPLEQYGIDSLVAIDIVRRLTDRVGSLPPTILFDQGTVEAVAEHLAAHRGEALDSLGPVAAPALNGTAAKNDECLVPVCATGSAPASFWVHSVVGEYSWVVRLSRHLGEGWPVYAFQMRGPALQRQGFTSLEALAATYVGALRRARPRGPYVLGGYSYGGALAYEMVRQLQQQGEPVDWLVLLDAYAPGSRSLEAIQLGAADTAALVQAAANLLALQWKGEPLLTAETLAGLDREGQIDAAVKLLHESCQGTPDTAGVRQSLCGLMETMEGHAGLLEAYQPQPLVGELRALLIRSSQGFVGESGVLAQGPFAAVAAGEHDHGWGRWLPAAPQIVEIPSNHFSLGQEPAIGLVAEALARCLAADDPAPAEGHDLRERVFTLLKQAVLDVLPETPPHAITLEASLRDLGANSIDRVEVANAVMEALNIDIPRTALGNLSNLQALTDVLCEQLAKTGTAGPAEGKRNVGASS